MDDQLQPTRDAFSSLARLSHLTYGPKDLAALARVRDMLLAMLPMQINCPDGCSQGMTLEIDVCWTGGLDPSPSEDVPVIPGIRYRCNDCPKTAELHP